MRWTIPGGWGPWSGWGGEPLGGWPRNRACPGFSPWLGGLADLDALDAGLRFQQGDQARRAQVVRNGTLHVFYRDWAGAIWDLGHEGGWRAQRLNLGAATGAPAAASDPVTLVPPSGWEYVAYVDVQGEVQLLSHALDHPWRLGPLERLGR